MSSTARSQSLRKPATSNSGPNSKTDSALETRRNVSPSKLPVKGMLGGSASSSIPSGARTRAASTVTKNGDVVSTTATTRSRPISGVFGLGRSASVRQPISTPSSNAGTSSAAVSRPPITSRNRPAPRPTSASGPSSLPSRPTSSSGVPSTSSRPAAGVGHARARSTATALTGATTLRPPAQPSSTKPTPPTHSSERPARSAALPPRLTHTRTSSTSSTSTSTSTTTAPRKRPVAPSDESSSLHPSTKPLPTRLAPKPAFSTLQQHYSPAKNLAPKPLTSTYLAPPSPSKLPSNIALSAETARLQTELLQLHLLRRDSDAVCAAWRESARRRLGDRFHALAAREREIRALEAAVVERGNVAALIHWGGGDQLEERTRLLDVVLSGVWAWNDTGGKYARVVRQFERWAEEMEGIVEARGGDLWPGEEVVFVSDLDASWKGECEPLGRKLEEWREVLRRDLRLERGKRVGESSLERIVAGLEALVDDMIAELALMVEIEREAIRREDEWVKSMNRSDDGGGNDTRAGAIWRVL
ncbi:hypothetical protein DL546_003375 [Coniochaeta pulveracea]|uniref:Uncharacterized protein n=1 Tax=Coniochaeta pulveracea TaxID=177199 RepID=A0A420Y300_9PEZI|nr:hypothetical protein DL546_003375 [Coniochaeta pulveracea]